MMNISPYVPNPSSRDASVNSIRLGVLRHDCASGDDAAACDRNPRQDHRAGADTLFLIAAPLVVAIMVAIIWREMRR